MVIHLSPRAPLNPQDGRPPPPSLKLHRDGVDATLFGVRVRVASLDHLIAMKEAAGRPRDLLMASEYRVISDELRRRRDDEEL